MSEPVEEADIRNFIHRFFFPLRNQKQNHGIRYNGNKKYQDRFSPSLRPTHTRLDDVGSDDESITRSSKSLDGSEVSVKSDNDFAPNEKADRIFVNTLWTTYDDLLILSIFTQVGIVFRLAVSTYFTFFDAVFSNDSALFVNMPLNCFSCFVLGLLCSGERLMEVIVTRFSPLDLQVKIQQEKNRKPFDYPSTEKSSLEEKDFDNDLDTNDYDKESMTIGTSVAVDDVSSSEGAVLKAPALFRRRGHLHRAPNDKRLYRGRRKKRRLHRSRRQQSTPSPKTWEPPLKLYDELRDVQLLALERRIRMSKCLVLFPAEQEDVDVMEHYFQGGYRRNDLDESSEHDEDERDVRTGKHDFKTTDTRFCSRGATRYIKTLPNDLELNEDSDHDLEEDLARERFHTSSSSCSSCDIDDATPKTVNKKRTESLKGSDEVLGLSKDHFVERSSSPNASSPKTSFGIDNLKNEICSDGESTAETADDTLNPAAGVDQMISEVTTNVSENISRLRRVNLLEGWDTGTTPTAMSDDVLLGLRAGFCGALSSFSSWNSAMGGLILQGRIGEAIIGYVLGVQLAIVSYRFGQHVAVYIFVWRARRQTKIAERRGYGLKLSQNDEEDVVDVDKNESTSKKEREIPSVRAFVTVIFVIALITQCVSLFFYRDPTEQQLALSLLFSPLGVVARWRLTKLNEWRSNFALGTFTSNILACALGGSLGTVLSGNAGPEERIILVSIISGFAGTLSSVGAFIEEILAGLDPILLRLDGLVYGVISIVAAMVVVLICSTSVDWADEVRNSSIVNETAVNYSSSNFGG